VLIAVTALIVRRRHLSWRDDVGVRAAPAGATVAWIAIYAAWMLGTNAVMHWRGPWDFSPWRNAPLLVDVGRVVTVGILGPIAEELFFRGALYGWLMRVRVNAFATVLVLAAAWSLMHVAYTPAVIALIFIDGLLLGAARHQMKSIVVPMLMHVMWNLYAIW
jgi:membrane protease YdiL (CAAX protease family)